MNEYDKVARQCAAKQVAYPRYLLRLTELDLLDRDRRAIERRIRQARFPIVKSLDSFDFPGVPSLNKAPVVELARCEFPSRKEILCLWEQRYGEVACLPWPWLICMPTWSSRALHHRCRPGERVSEARDDKHLRRFQSGVELLFETFSQRYEHAPTLMTSNLPLEIASEEVAKNHRI